LIKSKRMRWTGYVERMGEKKVVYRVWWRNLMETGHLEDTGVDGRIILRGMFRKWDVVVWTGLIWLRVWTGGGHL